MGWFSDFVGNPLGTVVQTVSDHPWETALAAATYGASLEVEGAAIVGEASTAGEIAGGAATVELIPIVSQPIAANSAAVASVQVGGSSSSGFLSSLASAGNSALDIAGAAGKLYSGVQLGTALLGGNKPSNSGMQRDNSIRSATNSGALQAAGNEKIAGDSADTRGGSDSTKSQQSKDSTLTILASALTIAAIIYQFSRVT